MRWALMLGGLLGASCTVPVSVGVQYGEAPRVLYTDLASGPASGGEDGLGAYLSIFGTRLGESLEAIDVSIGGVRVARKVGLFAANARPGVQQLTVQVGALGGQFGQALPIEVRVKGQRATGDVTFTVQPGDTFFVDNVSGNDTTGTKNDVTRPFRSLQTPSGGGVLALARGGDVIVLRGHATWSDTGADTRWARLKPVGSAPTGAVGSGPLTIMAYPGEVVRFVPPSGTRGGLHGSSAEPFVTWVTIAGLHLEGGDASVLDGPIMLQNGADHWRVVNTDLGPWAAGSSVHVGGIAGNGRFLALLGNHVHGLSGGELNCIGLSDGTSDSEIGWNLLEQCRSGSGVQLYMSDSTLLERIAVHHNLIRDTSRNGVLVGQGTLSAHVWNNELSNTDGAGLRIDQSLGVLDTIVEHNTVVQPCRVAGSVNAALVNTWRADQGRVHISNNVFVRGPASTCSVGYMNDGIDSALAFERNAFSGFAAPSTDLTALTGELGLSAEWHPSDASVLIDSSTHSLLEDDALGNPRLGVPDIGAYELPAPPLPLAPLELTAGCRSVGAPGGALALFAILSRPRRNRRRGQYDWRTASVDERIRSLGG